VSGGWTGSRRSLSPELQDARVQIEALARGYGLDFCETIFEVCDYDEINMIAAYGGFPTRYPHWRFGMDYLQMQKGYEYGLQKIYEMVINTDPSYAYLLDNNTMMDQKLVMAHVFGHVDFFTNNAWFAHTNRKMLDQMANHASRIRRYIDRHGVNAVESFIDKCLSIDNLIDPHRHHIRRQPLRSESDIEYASLDGDGKLPAKQYMDKFINPPEQLAAAAERKAQESTEPARYPAEPRRDVLQFLLENGRMERWQQDVLSIIQGEAYYFAPQAQTKILNEGWASFWHTRMMTQDILTDADLICYADHHAGTVAMRPGTFNPYKVGLELLRDIEDRWNKGQFGKDWMLCEDVAAKRDWDTGAMLGREKVFEVRKTHNDVTFVDAFLTEDVVRKIGLFTTEYDRSAGHWVISSRDFMAVKNKLLAMLSNSGNPVLHVTNGNHANRGELELTHTHEGPDIKLEWAAETMCNLAHLWGRPVHIQTLVDDKEVTLHHDGTDFSADGMDVPDQVDKQEEEDK